MSEASAVEVQRTRVNPAECVGPACSECGAWPPADPVRPYYRDPTVLCRACFVIRDQRSEALESFNPFRIADLLEGELRVGLAEERLPAVRRFTRAPGFSQLFEDLAGQVFGKLTVVSVEVVRDYRGHRVRWWRCRCACGVELVAPPTRLRLEERSCRACAQKARGEARRGELWREAERLGVSMSTLRGRRWREKKRLERAATHARSTDCSQVIHTRKPRNSSINAAA